MELVFHPASERGHANHGWLESYHSFSFAEYYNPSRIRAGLLRVLNDDLVAPGMGFGTHPHDNMEIISIPLSGSLAHRDSMGNVSVISAGEVQVMSAGTGITHSEFNPSDSDPVSFLQIWIFPRAKGLTPRYGQQAYTLSKGEFQKLVGPDYEGGVWINQDAWIFMGEFCSGDALRYEVRKPDNLLFIFVIEGSINAEGHRLGRRDAIELRRAKGFEAKAEGESKVMIIEIPE